jgi:hypothetical protein
MPGETKRASGQLVREIMQALESHGPMTAVEICEVLSYKRTQLSAVLFRMTKRGKRTPKRIYIQRYTHEAFGQKRYPRAVFAIGNRPDAPAEVDDPKEVRRRYDRKRRMLRTTNWVFNFGLTRREYTA